ncbi:MAG: hypothetical protein INR65_02960 [Gluconacetobacter diazotrophicus]|nr:hypothetical protein [Gluconacetobacter diazotrophicus]
MRLESRRAAGRVWQITWRGTPPPGMEPAIYLLPGTIGIDTLRAFVQLLWNGSELSPELQLSFVRTGKAVYEAEFLFDELGPVIRCGDDPWLEARLVPERAIVPVTPFEPDLLPG